MKLNKQILKQIIKEELENFSEAEGSTRSDTSSQYRETTISFWYH